VCIAFSPNVGILFLNGVVKRHRFDADPYTDSGLTFHLMPIRIRIRIRIDTHVLHKLEKKKKFPFIHRNASFSFSYAS
jgi:hypothetical protein